MINTDLIQNYHRVRQITENLCKPLAIEDYVPQPITDVSPPKWHLAHTTWFFETFILKAFQPNYREFDPHSNYLFNSYYQSLGTPFLRLNRGHLSRPTVAEIYHYRVAIDEQIEKLLSQSASQNNVQIHNLLILGLNHEQQHQELLVTDLKYILAQNPVMPVYGDTATIRTPSRGTQELSFPAFEGGIGRIGWDDSGFCYDNEQPFHETLVQPFRLSHRLITNGEYAEFIVAGGYHDFRHWLSDGWDWVKRGHIEAPLYWFQKDGQWLERTLAGDRPIALNTPVCHVSFFEAEAFASWCGKRLPTEQEWELAAQKCAVLDHPATLLGTHHFHPQPCLNEPLQSLSQMIGEVWEWTNSAYLPYPGYLHTNDALGEYNGKFMSGQMVLRGGSCATPDDHIRMTYRNFFQPEKRWQFMGFRLAESIS